jgi:PAS domain-containing protein
MPNPGLTDAECIEALNEIARFGGNIKAAALANDKDESTFRHRAEVARKRKLKATAEPRAPIEHPQRQTIEIQNGVAIVFSDAHFWPGIITTAHRAVVKFCRELKPKLVVNNGDAIDGATISRHPPIGWENRPKLVDEIIAAQERLGEIRDAAPKAIRTWNLGNHDGRYETRLAQVAPEFAKIHGVHLKDHFGDDWRSAWSTWINDDVVIKHRLKGGIHATHNNTLAAGKSIVTGHLHSLKVTPWSDYNGVRYGVDTGTTADPYGPMFTDYMEDGPRNWRSGFVVLTFHKGRLLWPEVCHVLGKNEVEFQGKVIRV